MSPEACGQAGTDRKAQAVAGLAAAELKSAV